MDTPGTPEYQPPKVGTGQCRASSPLSKGGRRRNSGTKRKRTVPKANAAEPTNPETINALTAPSADIETAGPSEDGEDRHSKPAGLSHPKRNEMRRYDVRERLQMKGQVLQASNEAKERLAATIPLPRLSAKQRRISLPRPKDQRVVPENMRDSKTQALPIERDTKKANYDPPQAGKGGSPTWKGEAVSKSKLRRMKAKSRIIELEQGECEGNDIITHPANPSAHYSSQIVTRLPHNNHNNSNPRQTSPVYFLGNLLQTDRENSEKMSNLRGVPPTGRGRNSGRISRNQHSSNDNEPSFRNSPNTSTGGTRRPRGFQPTEVNIGTPPEASATHSVLQHHSYAAALREPVSSIKVAATEADPPKPDLVNIGPLTKSGENRNSSIQATVTEAAQPKSNPVNVGPLTKSGENGNSSIQATAAEAAQPKSNPVNVGSLTKSGENGNSLSQLTEPEETREHKASFWSKVTRPPEGPTPGWDSSEQDISQPSWKLNDAIVPTYAHPGKRANMDNLPPYKFPRKKPQNPAAESFNRQMAGIEKGPVQRLRESSSSVNAGAMSATRYNSRKDATHPAKDNSPESLTHTTKNSASEQGFTVKLPQAIEVMSTTVPPHLRGPSHCSQSRDVPVEASKSANAADNQPESHLTTSVKNLKITDPRAIDEEEAQAGKATIAAMSNYEVPPHLQVAPLHKSRTTEKSKSMTLSSDHHENNGAQRNVNIDEEVAAGLNAIDNDEELAVALQAEWSGGKEFTQQDQSHDFETSKPQAQTLQTEKPAGSKNPDRTPDNTSGATKHQESQGEALPPHLRILVTTKSTSQAIGEPSNIPVEPMSTQQSGPKSTTRVGTRSEGLKNITNDGAVKQVHYGGAFAKTAKSAVKAGKQPARNDDLLHGNADLVNWDGTLAPPLQGEDWADRVSFDRSNRDRKSLIEAWREEQASEAEVTGGVKIDTKSLEFQTGKGLIGGNGDVLSFIDDSDHKAIPNDDDFTQDHREQNAAAAIEQYKAETASKQKSTKSGESNGTRQPERRELKRVVRDQDEDYDLPSREYAPKANIYLRPAESSDMRQCTDIYNQWALDTAFTVMLNPVDTAYWTECYNSSQDDRTPFLVAIHTGQKRYNELKDVRRTKGETIIGFSVATSYGSRNSVYRYSVELELYVHREHLRQGVGRTMLDRMLTALCQDYSFMDCAPLLLSKGHHLHAWIGGGVPIVHTLAVNLLHWAGEDHENVEWKLKWLSGGRNSFEHVGTLPRIGYKFAKPVNNCLMLRDSGSILTPH